MSSRPPSRPAPHTTAPDQAPGTTPDQAPDQAPARLPRKALDTGAGAATSPGAGPAGTAGAAPKPLAEVVAAHLQHYFDLHGTDLPPAGLHARVLAEVERPLLELALIATGGNQLRCTELLGLNRNTLRKKLAEHNIEVTRRRRVM